MDISAALEANEVFAVLGGRRRSRLSQSMAVKTFEPGTVIVRQGASSVALYLILSGEVEIRRAPESGGQDVLLAVLGPPDYFGEMGLIDDEPRSTTVIARSATTCAIMTRWDFQQEIAHTPAFAAALLRALCRRIRVLDEQLARVSS
jgi:CRP-like cAMP-binding protein